MTWNVVDNPAWAGRQPARLTESGCHDRSHLVTLQCACGEQMHLHETQWQRAHGQPLAAPCHGCGQLLIILPKRLDRILAEERKHGWIA